MTDGPPWIAGVPRYHCVAQLTVDSWEYRVKRADDEPNREDLVPLADVLDAVKRQEDEITRLLKAIVIAWDADQDLDFDEALDAARAHLGFTLTPEAERGETLRGKG